MTNYIFTPQSALACLARAPEDWFEEYTLPTDGSWEVVRIATPQATFFVHRKDTDTAQRILLLSTGGNPLNFVPLAARRSAFQRIHRAAVAAQRLPFFLPRDWSVFHHANLVAFFACPSPYGSYRWIMEIGPLTGTIDVCFWEITTDDRPVLLQDFASDHGRISNLLEDWPSVLQQAQTYFATVPEPSRTEALQYAVDLQAVAFGAVTKYQTYTQWRSLLTQPQLSFVDTEIAHSVKLRGPAGSGKTLALEMKALRELYRGRERRVASRILFATHSWAMADQVDSAVRQLDESGDVSDLEVLPLLAIAQDRLPKERAGTGFTLLGEDSLSGKHLQLDRIGSLVDGLRRGDWLTMRSGVSSGFAARVEAPLGSLDRNALVWDLMNEFASVLSANGILPGINAERKYLVSRHISSVG